MEELLDELFEAVTHLHHYMGGMLDDMKNKRYNLEESSADLAVVDASPIRGILNDIYELYAESENAYEEDDDEDDEEDVTTEMPVTVDVWSHYGGKN